MEHILYVVGFGPGGETKMTREAFDILGTCEVIIGYRTYVEELRKTFPDANYITSGMTKEEERCLEALEESMKHERCAIVSSGDAGIYGMASLVLELSVRFPKVTVRVVPGVTAALSGGAILGAPLANDTALISLSDRLTTWEIIEKRLKAAAEGDFAIALYNPASHGRKDHLKRACDILMTMLPADRVCGYVRNIGREGEEYRICTLSELREAEVDMTTTVFVGASDTVRIGGHMVTRRGYHKKHEAI